MNRTIAAFGVAALAACSDGSGPNDPDLVVPVTPDVVDLPSDVVDGVREFRITASVFTQQIATFPLQNAEVWGYNGSTPGPTAIAYEGETVRFVVQNELPEPTTVHFHGSHMPNEDDGVPGISQPTPIPPGGSHVYEFTPEHPGTFAYHAHVSVQELRGLAGFLVVLPRDEPERDRVDQDFLFVLQSFFVPSDGAAVLPFPPGGEFNFHTINGRTRDAGSDLDVRVGERVRIRFYDASNLLHSMHQHGFDMTIVSQNGHLRPEEGQFEVTTVDVGPGNFYEVEVTFDKPGQWIFHCHFPHHTANAMMSGPNGSPVGMTRIFNVTE